jgi:hypothetical protein
MKNIITKSALGIIIALNIASLSAKIKDAPDNFQIKISQAQAQDEITFWAQQMSEHALFLSLGLEDAGLRQKAQQLHKNWENFRKNYKGANSEAVVPMLKELHAFQQQVIKAMGNGKNWIGWMYQAMVEHMDLELLYFRNKLAGVQYTLEDELEFWNTEHSQGALATAHLLDPTEKKDTLKGMELADKFEQNEKKKSKTTDDMWLTLTQKYTKELDEYYTTGKSKAKMGQQKSIIHPVLRDHEEREVKRSEEIFAHLKKQVESKSRR